MTPLRNQLLAARSDYQQIHFPGDLAATLPAAPERRPLQFPRALRLAIGLAAALLIFVMGREYQLNRESLAASSLSVTQLDLNHWESTAASFTRVSELPTMQTMAPPQASELLSAVEKPLYDSGNFIVSIGKDLAHHAGALFQMM